MKLMRILNTIKRKIVRKFLSWISLAAKFKNTKITSEVKGPILE